MRLVIALLPLTHILRETEIQVNDWKGAGLDKIQGFWLKSFATVHEVLATVLNECIEVANVPGWLLEERPILVMKE